MFAHFTPTLYLQLRADRLSARHLPSGKEIVEPPLLAIQTSQGKRQAVAVGHAAQSLQGREGIELFNGFDHPRSLLADFAIAEKTLQLFIQRLAPKSLLSRSPTVVLHPLEHLEGGLTQVETRGLYELCRSAGARKVYLWTGRELTTEELLTLQFPDGAGSLLNP